MAGRRHVAWQVGSLVQLATLGVWLVHPGSVWAIAAVSLSLVMLVLAASSRRPASVAVSVLGLAGSAAALHTSWQVGGVESDWPTVREQLVDRATAQLETTLGDAVAMVEALAMRGASIATQSRTEAFALLEGGLAGRTPERGVVVFGDDDRPWVWAGNPRFAMVPEGEALVARVTPLYVVLEARRTRDGRTAVGQVVLSASSAIPNREATVAAGFRRATGSGLEFFEAQNAPFEPDVSDYCLPACDGTGVPTDTLFAVRPVPPTQGTLKLELLDRGGRRVSVALAAALVVLTVVAPLSIRWISVCGIGALLVLTPIGARLGFEGLFSPRSYFVSAWDWVAATAGTVIVLSGLAIVGLAAVWRIRPPKGLGALAGAAVLVGIPFVLLFLVGGVTSQAIGASLSIWLGWVLATGSATEALTLVSAWLVRPALANRLSRWPPWAAGSLTVVLGLIGTATWAPGRGWGPVFIAAWIVAFVLAIHSEGIVRMVVSTSVVSAALAALLTWGAALNGQIALAERDAARFGPDADPVPMGFLEDFGYELQAQGVPRTDADLYMRWTNSPLSRDDYPAKLVTWGAENEPIARLELASLDIPDGLLGIHARTARDGHEPSLDVHTKVPGVHYILSVPFIDESVVTVAVGPRSRAIQPIRVARFLRGDLGATAPYTMEFSDLQPLADDAASLQWRRDGTIVRGEQPFEVPGGSRHLHIEVDLGGTASNVFIRGALLTILFVSIVGMLWLAGEALRGRLPLADWLGRVRLHSYRTRLAVVLVVFFVIPTIGFALWSVGRLRVEVSRTRDAIVRQSLQDAAAGTSFNFAVLSRSRAKERLDTLAARVDADLILYEDGVLAHSSAPVLSELGLLEPYTPPNLYRRLVLEDGLEATADRIVGGRATRVGYRTLTEVAGRSLILASPRLAEDAPVRTELYTLLLAALLGTVAAIWLGTRAADSLAQPVRALSRAASAVGRGEPVREFDPGTPQEFVPVVHAFEQMARDVRSNREALEEALEFTGAVLRNVATGVMTLDADLHVTTANPRAIALLGRDPVSYQPVSETTESEWAVVWEWVEAFARDGSETDVAEFTIGDKRIRALVAKLTTVDGGEGGCVVAIDDATELAMAERVLAWGQMAQQVAHEIKNPLTPIRLGIQHIQRAYRDRKSDFDTTLDKTAQQILAEIERLDAIARAFSRFGAPPVEATPLTSVNPAEVARETASLYGLGGGTTVSVTSADGRSNRLRRDELKEVLINLIENARAAGATEIGIEIQPGEDRGSRVVVRDNGDGIPEEDIQHIFVPHFSTTTSGAGLGLAICKRLVESWGGTIAAQSNPGEGTTITLELK